MKANVKKNLFMFSGNTLFVRYEKKIKNLKMLFVRSPS